MKIKVKKLKNEATVPCVKTAYSAGADLYSTEEYTVAPFKTVIVSTGIAVEIPTGYAGFVFARSGLSTKRGLAPANKVGVIDSDYRGEILVALYNQSGQEQVVEKGERVAQLIVSPVAFCEFELVSALGETERGEGGFGSTGK